MEEPSALAKLKRAPQCADEATCVQPLEAGEPAPYPGALVPYDLAAEIVVSASVTRTIFELELRTRDAKHEVELRAQRELLRAAQEASTKREEVLRAELAKHESWTRSPLLWLGLGVVLAGGVGLLFNK